MSPFGCAVHWSIMWKVVAFVLVRKTLRFVSLEILKYRWLRSTALTYRMPPSRRSDLDVEGFDSVRDVDVSDLPSLDTWSYANMMLRCVALMRVRCLRCSVSACGVFRRPSWRTSDCTPTSTMRSSRPTCNVSLKGSGDCS